MTSRARAIAELTTDMKEEASMNLTREEIIATGDALIEALNVRQTATDPMVVKDAIKCAVKLLTQLVVDVHSIAASLHSLDEREARRE